MAYKFQNRVTKKFILSKDVTFFENNSLSHHVVEASNQPFYPPQLPRLHVQEEPCHSKNGTYLISESMSDSISLEDDQKTRSIKKLYEKEREPDQQNMFGFISSQPIDFKGTINENHQADSIN